MDTFIVLVSQSRSGWAMQMALQITSKKDLCALPLDNYDLGGSYTNPCDTVASTINVSNSDDTYSVNTSTDLELPDITHTDSDGSPVILPAQTPFVATLCGSGVSHSSEVYKSGQTIIRQTGDDGDLQLGNGTTFFDLGYNNGFGTTNRFTKKDGTGLGATEVWLTDISTSDIIVDWSTWDRVNDTVLCWNPNEYGTNNWDGS